MQKSPSESKLKRNSKRRHSLLNWALFFFIVVVVFSFSLFIVDLDDVQEGQEVHIQLEAPTEHSSLQQPHHKKPPPSPAPPAKGGAGVMGRKGGGKAAPAPAPVRKGGGAGGGEGKGEGEAGKAHLPTHGEVVPRGARGRPVGTPYAMRLYVYDDVPAALNRKLRQLRDCRVGYSAAEVLIPELIATSDLYTRHGDLADYYVVPILSECYLIQKLHQGMDFFKAVQSFNAVFSHVLDRIQAKYPYWMRTEGRDHIFVFPSERGVGVLNSDNLLRIKKSIFVVGMTPRSGAHFSSWKDIVVPPAPYGLPEIPESDREEEEEADLFPRDILMHFRGHITGEEDKNMGGLRAHLHAAMKKEKGVVFAHANEECDRNCTFAEMLRSKYCLVPGGEVEGWSMRLVHAVALGCVPVIVDNDVELPFEDLVDWRQFSLKVMEEGVDDLAEELRGTSRKAWEAKKKALEAVKSRFTFHDTWQPGDAFDSLLQVLSQKYRFFRNSPYRFWSDTQPYG